ncbi:hypothetical protein DPMN_064464 [Dreissena polymorpha]|uniref:Uncharacterized protein n=1 Tax=Dreissena polymorpha TaxID=45954 RepID=A0A9D4HJH4_DREPO|nr:hypothetical protein DPMN_064464 [Dreissena polymorpha]
MASLACPCSSQNNSANPNNSQDELDSTKAPADSEQGQPPNEKPNKKARKRVTLNWLRRTNDKASRKAGRQASRQACRQADRLTGRHAGMQTGRLLVWVGMGKKSVVVVLFRYPWAHSCENLIKHLRWHYHEVDECALLVIQTELTPPLGAQPSPDSPSALPLSPCSFFSKTMHGIQKANLDLYRGVTSHIIETHHQLT